MPTQFFGLRYILTILYFYCITVIRLWVEIYEIKSYRKKKDYWWNFELNTIFASGLHPVKVMASIGTLMEYLYMQI